MAETIPALTLIINPIVPLYSRGISLLGAVGELQFGGND